MKRKLTRWTISTALMLGVALSAISADLVVGKSPWGPDDAIGRLNLITEASRRAMTSRIPDGVNATRIRKITMPVR